MATRFAHGHGEDVEMDPDAQLLYIGSGSATTLAGKISPSDFGSRATHISASVDLSPSSFPTTHFVRSGVSASSLDNITGLPYSEDNQRTWHKYRHNVFLLIAAQPDPTGHSDTPLRKSVEECDLVIAFAFGKSYGE
ncbi:hypothetical protein HDU93_005414 [Gonapodya sp. JEL0774]|nr:hypothetical protein HDU93_005414 [Gonapodya sp. JEL0774]